MEIFLRAMPSWKVIPLLAFALCFCIYSTSWYYTESLTTASHQLKGSGHRKRLLEAPAPPKPTGNLLCSPSNTTAAESGVPLELSQCTKSDERTKANSAVGTKEAVDTFVFSRGSMSKNDTATQIEKEKNASVLLSENTGDIVVEDIPAESPETENAASRVLASSAMKDLSGYISVLNRKVQLDLHCTSCAYVSNSGQLFGANAGSTIDSFPCVIRMNNAPTEGFEKDVGIKTTVRMVAHSALSLVVKGKSKLLAGKSQPKYMVVWGPPSKMRTDGKGVTYNAAASLARLKEADGMQMFVVSDGQMDIADSIFEKETNRNRIESGSWLSTGWFTMLLARAMCDDIHVFGMVNDSYCMTHPNSKVPYHYFQGKKGYQECSYYQANEKAKKSSHRFVTEKTVFARWAGQGVPSINFHTPDWTPPAS